ncbi:hypothetical protein BH11PSE14_BH11PSE14_12750 [soil metagenome]
MAIMRVLAAPLFAVIAVAQAIRFVEAWPVTINGFSLPLWASAVAAVAFGALAILVWRESGARARS